MRTPWARSVQWDDIPVLDKKGNLASGSVGRTALAADVASAVVTNQVPNRSLVVPLGDSTIAASSGLHFYSGGDWMTKLVFKSKGRLAIHGWAATGGYRIDATLARIDADIFALSPRPAYCLVLVGINDLGNGWTPAQVKAGLSSIYDKLVSGGVCPIPITILPNDTAGRAVQISEVNAWILAEAARRGFPCVDVYSSLVDPATGKYRAGYSGDGTHPTAGGLSSAAEIIATKVWSEVGPLFTAPPFLADNNVGTINMLSNGVFVGDTNADGLANTWSWNGLGGTVTPSLEAGTDEVLGNWQKVVVSAPGTRELVQSPGVTTGFSVGDVVELTGRFDLTTSDGMTFSVRLRASTPSVVTIADAIYNLAYTQSGVFRVRGVVPAGTTSLSPSIVSNVGTGTWKVAQIALVNLTRLGIA